MRRQGPPSKNLFASANRRRIAPREPVASTCEQSNYDPTGRSLREPRSGHAAKREAICLRRVGELERKHRISAVFTHFHEPGLDRFAQGPPILAGRRQANRHALFQAAKELAALGKKRQPDMISVAPVDIARQSLARDAIVVDFFLLGLKVEQTGIVEKHLPTASVLSSR